MGEDNLTRLGAPPVTGSPSGLLAWQMGDHPGLAHTRLRSGLLDGWRRKLMVLGSCCFAKKKKKVQILTLFLKINNVYFPLYYNCRKCSLWEIWNTRKEIRRK